MEPLKVMLVEDNSSEAADVVAYLMSGYPDLVVKQIATEREFRDRLDAIRQDPPDLFVMDIMLPWTEPSPKMPPVPLDVQEGGFFFAGVRCLTLLANHPNTSAVPVILCTVMGLAEIENNLGGLPIGGQVAHVSKASARLDEELLKAARRLLPLRV